MQKNSKQLSKTLLKSSFIFLLFLAACSTPLESTMSKVERIDNAYGVSLTDYEVGLTKFDDWERDPPLNQEELEEYLVELSQITATSSEAQAYVEFRRLLAQSELDYKIALRKPFAGYNDVIRCSRAQDQLASIETVRVAAENLETATEVYKENQWTFMPDNWRSTVLRDQSDILEEAESREDIILKNCELQQTQLQT